MQSNVESVSEITTPEQNKGLPGKPRKAKISKTMQKPRMTEKKELILQCKNKHPLASERKIAKETESSAAYVHQVLEEYNINQGKLEKFKSNRADILDGIGMGMLGYLSSNLKEKAESATLQQISTAYGIIQDKSAAIRNPIDTSTKPLIIINQIRTTPNTQGSDNIIDISMTDTRQSVVEQGINTLSQGEGI
jgi:hypothetical protein